MRARAGVQVPVALVTRNTKASVQAFLDLIGPEWASLFDTVLTREFAFVKPDRRLLLHVAQVRGMLPWVTHGSRVMGGVVPLSMGSGSRLSARMPARTGVDACMHACMSATVHATHCG